MRLLVAILLTNALTAQAPMIWPPAFARAEASSSSSLGLGAIVAGDHVLQIDGLKSPRMINAIAFRRDGPGASPATGPVTMIANIVLSRAGTLPAGPLTPLAANHLAPLTIHPLVSLNLPAVPPVDTDTIPRAFDRVIPFPSPYAFTPLLSLGFCWEIQVVATSATTRVLHDLVGPPNTNPQPVVHSRGLGCRPSWNQNVLSFGALAQASWGAATASISLQSGTCKPGAFVSMALSVDSTTWGGVPLPFAVPFTDYAPSGLCTVYSNWLTIMVVGLASSTGALSSTFPMSIAGIPAGANIKAQIVAPDPTANVWGMVLSNEVQIHFPPPYAGGDVGLVHRSAGSSTDVALPNQGFVVEYR